MNKNYLFNNLTKSKKIRITQRIFSLALLIILISLPIYYSWPAPSKAEITAVKLSVRVHAESETKITIIVAAVDETGNLDTKRDDEIELSFEGATTSKLSQSRVKLEKGQARVGLEVLLKESSFLKAKWITGPTPLRDAKILVSPLMWDY
ncbi:hypothetical protein [[Eubacterium] cellulosolvens]